MSDQLLELNANLLEREINVSVNWDTLGTHLGLSQGEIRQIERDHHTTERRRVEMFDRWLRKEENPSWEKIIAALENMSEKSISSQLRKKYAMQDQPVKTPTSEGPLDLFRRPCECNHELMIERVLKVDRKDLIGKELERLKKTYFRLKMSAESALESANPSPRQLKRFSQEYLSDREVTTVEELFDCLEEFCFLDYALLENIISIFLDNKAQIISDLNDYIQELTDFKKSTTLNEFTQRIETAQKPLGTANEATGVCTVTLRLVGGWLKKTMEDLQKLLKEVFQDKSSVLAHLKMVRGSVIVTYLASHSEVESLIELSKTKLLFMIQVGVCELNIGSKRIIKNEVPHFSFESSLVLAVWNNDITLLTFLLNIRTSPDATDGEGWTALMRGSFSGRDKAVSLLVNAKADLNIKRRDGVTALYLAAQNGHFDVFDILLKAKANPNLLADDGTTPLDIARQNGHSNVVSALQKICISEGATVTATHLISAEEEIIATHPFSEGVTTTATRTISAEGETISTHTISPQKETITTRTISAEGETITTRTISEGEIAEPTTRWMSRSISPTTTTHKILHRRRTISEGANTEPTTHWMSRSISPKTTAHKMHRRRTISEGAITEPKTTTRWMSRSFSEEEPMPTKPLEEAMRDEFCEDNVFEEATKPQSVSIVILGKSGSGKTSLTQAIASIDMHVDKSTKSSTRSSRRVHIQVGQGSVNIFDTHGMMSRSVMETLDEMIIKCTDGVIILCMDMYEGLDESTLEPLALLHKKFGRRFWSRVIIALTKADCYEEQKWLMTKSGPESKREFLSVTFAVELEERRTIILRKDFTATADQALPRCHIGMSERNFDEIPIIPTSLLDRPALERMEQVGHGYWFDLLLIKCCQRLRAQGSGLQIHQDRLSQLPPELIRHELSRTEYRWFRRNRRLMSADFKDPLTHQTSSVTKPRFVFKQDFI